MEWVRLEGRSRARDSGGRRIVGRTRRHPHENAVRAYLINLHSASPRLIVVEVLYIAILRKSKLIVNIFNILKILSSLKS